MNKDSFKGSGPIIAISFLFLLISHSFILERTLSNSSSNLMTIRGDTLSYVAMSQGQWITTLAPFKFRVLVPFLAGLLPFSPMQSLSIISYLSLFLSYIFTFLVCARVGLSRKYFPIGWLVVMASPCHLYYYNNPFLTDAFALSMLCVMVFALNENCFALFVTAALLGILARETTIFLVPAWLVTKQWRNGFLLIGISVIVLFLPRYFLASATDLTLGELLKHSHLINEPFFFFKSAYSAWDFTWFLSILGIWYLPDKKFIIAVGVYFCLISGAVITSIIAVDTGRMLSILFPIFLVSCTSLYAQLINERKWVLALILPGLAIFQALTDEFNPNVLMGENSWIMHLYVHVFLLIIETSYIFILILSLKRSLLENIKKKMLYLGRKTNLRFRPLTSH